MDQPDLLGLFVALNRALAGPVMFKLRKVAIPVEGVVMEGLEASLSSDFSDLCG